METFVTSDKKRKSVRTYKVDLRYKDPRTDRTTNNRVITTKVGSLDALRRKLLVEYGHTRIDAFVYAVEKDGSFGNHIGELDMGYCGMPAWYTSHDIRLVLPTGRLSADRNRSTHIGDREKFSANGIPILKIWDSFGQLNVLGKKYNGEYVFGRNYDLKKGYWMGGTYSYSLKELQKHPRVNMSGKLIVNNTKRK